jgi:hypothetical protein
LWKAKMASERKLAQSVVDVILGEAAHTTPEGRLRDMQAIASVIANRARRQHRTPQQIVSAYSLRGKKVEKQFDAYNKAIPAGAEKYRQLAERAWRDIEGAGPVTDATFYATPRAWQTGYVPPPPPFQQVLQTDGHIFKVDPANRPITTTPADDGAQPLDAEPPFTPRKQPPFYDQGQFKALPHGAGSSLIGQEPLAPRTSAAASASQPDAGRLTNQTDFWSNPTWQSYLFDFARPGAAQLPDSVRVIPQPRPNQLDPIDTRSIRGQRAGGSVMPARGASDSVAQYARLIRALLGGLGSARPFSATQNSQAANGGRFDSVAVTRVIREMQQAGASADEIRQMIAEARRRAAGD